MPTAGARFLLSLFVFGEQQRDLRILLPMTLEIVLIYSKGDEIVLERKCCPLWAILSIILFLATAAVIAYVVLNKLHMLGNHYRPMDEGYWPDEPEHKVDDSGVRYTTDQDFV